MAAGSTTPLLLAAALVVSACSSGEAATTDAVLDTTPTTAAPAPTRSPTTPAPTAQPPTPTTAATTEPGSDPDCVVVVVAGDSLGAIAGRVDGVTVADLQAENRLPDDAVIHPDDELDVCIGNDVDDVTGLSRLAPDAAAVRRQQEELNELFAPYSIAELAVDGDSGPMTRQLICAARLGLGLRPSTAHLPEGSDDEETIFAATSLSIPSGAPTWTDRWILIDETCQIAITGEGDDRIVDVFPTSTGEPGFETHNVRALDAFRYDPAADNGGWHDSSRFPVSIDNPLNGNMYKPLYFNRGQAIHGANYVPTRPNSKGCARLFPWHHDRLIAWLGLDGLTEPTWRAGQIGVTVSVQGEYREFD